MIQGNVKITSSWKEFKIVETVSGSFTGQVTIDDPAESEHFSEISRVMLRDYTKEQIELALQITICPFNSDRKLGEKKE